jgi:cytochrome c-type biogenesis protein CcmH/NrfF
MIRSWTAGIATLAAIAAAFAVPASAGAQTSAPPLGLQGGPAGGHYHVGETGEQLLVIERHLRCNCSCGLDVHSCQFQMQCGVSPGWTQRILSQLQAGESPEAIEAGFVADFGGTVLMSPPAEGFNLIGYLLPSVAIVTAGMLIGLLVRGNAGRARMAPVTEVAEADAERLRDALRRLDEAEGPDW